MTDSTRRHAVENTEGLVGRNGGRPQHASGLEDLNVNVCLVMEFPACAAPCEDREGLTHGSRAALESPETLGALALWLHNAR